MSNCSRAGSRSPFPDRPLFWPFRSMPRRKARRYRRSPSPRQLTALGHPALGVGCLVVLAGCGESLVPDPPPLTVGPPVAASVVPAAPNPGILADAAELPRVKDVVGGLLKPGCVLHYRTREDLYVEHRFELRFSPSAREASGRLRILLYGVDVTVKRPTADTADAEMETLPKRLGIRSVCKIPDTALGESEARAFIEDELRNKGIDVAASSAQGSAARGPVGEAARLARSGVRGVWNWLAPRPLSAAQGRIESCETWFEPGEAGIKCTITIIEITVTCPFGLDFEASSGDCIGGFTSSTPIHVFITPPGSKLGGLGIGGTKIPVDPGDDDDDDDDTTCTDDQVAIATEYEADPNSPPDLVVRRVHNPSQKGLVAVAGDHDRDVRHRWDTRSLHRLSQRRLSGRCGDGPGCGCRGIHQLELALPRGKPSRRRQALEST